MPYNFSFYYEAYGTPAGPISDRQERNLMNTLVTNKIVRKLLPNWKQVRLTTENRQKAEAFIKLKAKAKLQERQGWDSEQVEKRERTGTYIELSVFQQYGVADKFDFSVVENSGAKGHPDFSPLGAMVDVKGSAFGKVPMVFKENRGYPDKNGKRFKCPVIVCMYDEDNSDTVYLCGIATPRVLETDVDDNLIVIGSSAVDRKTGFFGYTNLLPMPTTLDELKTFCNQRITYI